MQFLSSLLHFLGNRTSRRNILLLARFLIILTALITVDSVIFHFIMAWEGHDYSWVTGFYWTLTVMSTLGFGDITFHTDLGRLFSICVLLTGIGFLLVLLPFTFIEFFYAPWVAAQSAARAPRVLPPGIKDHVVITHLDGVTDSLIHKLTQFEIPYVLLVPDLTEALRLYDEGYLVVVGDIDLPDTYQAVRVHEAAMVVTTASDPVNTNVAFTVREMCEKVPIISTADVVDSVDILELAGSSKVLRLGEMMGLSLARRAYGGRSMTHVIGSFGEILIAEGTPVRTSLVGQTLQESRLRQETGISVIGVWERGRFGLARPDTLMGPNTVLVMAGSREHLDKFEERFSSGGVEPAPIVIVGSGRVGRATANALEERDIDYRIVEKDPGQITEPGRTVSGDAANLKVLEKAGLREAPTVILTTSDDDINIYIANYCRRLRPDIRIVSRANLERNVATLHRAGADLVMCYPTMGADSVFNLLKRSDMLLVGEGLIFFRLQVPPLLAGQQLSETAFRKETGCSIVAIRSDTVIRINPAPSEVLDAGSEIILVGSLEGERSFLDMYGAEDTA